MSRSRDVLVHGALAILLTARFAAAACGDEPGDSAALAAARAAVAACPCDTTSHRDYVRCAGEVTKDLLDTGQLSAACRKAARKCASRSTCGKPAAVTCCRPRSDGTSRCSITAQTAALRRVGA